jgi:hypothetical protein
LLLFLDLELIDHNPEDCLECNGRRNIKKTKKGFINNVKRIAGNMIRGTEVDKGNKYMKYKLLLYTLYLIYHYFFLFFSLIAINLPESIAVLPSTIQIRLLHTLIRDKTLDNITFSNAIDRLSQGLLGCILERLEINEKLIQTIHGTFNGIELLKFVSIGMDKMSEEIIEYCMKPFHTIIKRLVGKMLFDPPIDELIPLSPVSKRNVPITRILYNVILPDNIETMNIIIFVPVVGLERVNEVVNQKKTKTKKKMLSQFFFFF